MVIAGWVLVIGTLILCGLFLVIHNVTVDSCVAVNEWIQYPTTHTTTWEQWDTLCATYNLEGKVVFPTEGVDSNSA